MVASHGDNTCSEQAIDSLADGAATYPEFLHQAWRRKALPRQQSPFINGSKDTAIDLIEWCRLIGQQELLTLKQGLLMEENGYKTGKIVILYGLIGRDTD